VRTDHNILQEIKHYQEKAVITAIKEGMTAGSKYVEIVEWSDTDNCFLGSCPELFYGAYHGTNGRVVFDELWEIIDESVRLYKKDGKPLPSPICGKELVNELQKVA
jgi:predicted RNase H-like HicB family nuclease